MSGSIAEPVERGEEILAELFDELGREFGGGAGGHWLEGQQCLVHHATFVLII